MMKKDGQSFFHLKHRPATFLIDTAGDVSWQHPGSDDQYRIRDGPARRIFPPSVVSRHVWFSPMYGPGVLSQLHFRNCTRANESRCVSSWGAQPYWCSGRARQQASIEAIRDLVDICGNSGRRAPVVLAINDGEPLETVKRASEGIKAVIVPDPDRRAISAAFGINLWPTSIYLDAGGLITDICYGRFCGGMQKTSSTAAAD